MVQRQRVAPPTQFTVGDKVRLATGAMILVLGIVIFWRTLPFGINWQAIVVSAAFIGFGVYRLWLGYTRLGQYKKRAQ